MTNKLTLPIEIGRRYVRRDGQVVTARATGSDSMLEVSAAEDGCEDTWVFADDGRISNHRESPQDLIADAPEEPTTYAITDYAEVLRAIADGKEVEVKLTMPHGPWNVQLLEFTLREIGRGLLSPAQFRIKPDTLTINGREVPAPVRGGLLLEQEYWLVKIEGIESPYTKGMWDGGRIDRVWLSRGLIHLTEEAARQHAEALLSFTRKD